MPRIEDDEYTTRHSNEFSQLIRQGKLSFLSWAFFVVSGNANAVALLPVMCVIIGIATCSV